MAGALSPDHIQALPNLVRLNSRVQIPSDMLKLLFSSPTSRLAELQTDLRAPSELPILRKVANQLGGPPGFLFIMMLEVIVAKLGLHMQLCCTDIVHTTGQGCNTTYQDHNLTMMSMCWHKLQLLVVVHFNPYRLTSHAYCLSAAAIRYPDIADGSG